MMLLKIHVQIHNLDALECKSFGGGSYSINSYIACAIVVFFFVETFKLKSHVKYRLSALSSYEFPKMMVKESKPNHIAHSLVEKYARKREPQ